MLLTLVNGLSSLVMRSRRDEVWCILLEVSDGTKSTGAGALAKVSEYGCEGGFVSSRDCRWEAGMGAVLELSVRA